MIKHKALQKEFEKYKQENGTTYVFIAKQLGVKEGTFRQILIGNCKVSMRLAIKFSTFLKVPLFEIWTEK